MCEFAPASPWNTILFDCDMVVLGPGAPCGTAQFCSQPFQILGRVDLLRRAVDDHDVDAHAGLERAQLLEFFSPFELRGRQADEPGERRTPECVKAEMVI